LNLKSQIAAAIIDLRFKSQILNLKCQWNLLIARNTGLGNGIFYIIPPPDSCPGMNFISVQNLSFCPEMIFKLVQNLSFCYEIVQVRNRVMDIGGFWSIALYQSFIQEYKCNPFLNASSINNPASLFKRTTFPWRLVSKIDS
jgi:hypothetical protein